MLWDMEKQYFNSGVILKLYQTAAANWCEILSLHDAAVTSPAHFETMGATFWHRNLTAASTTESTILDLCAAFINCSMRVV